MLRNQCSKENEEFVIVHQARLPRARACAENFARIVLRVAMLRLRTFFASRRMFYAQHDKGSSMPTEPKMERDLARCARPDSRGWLSLSCQPKNQADPLCRVTGPRMNPSVDVGRPPRPFRHLRMAQHRTPDPSSSRAPVHSALVQISVTRHHQPCRPAFKMDARQIARAWQVEDGK